MSGPRTWTIYVCPQCGKTSTENALCCVVGRKHGKVTYGARGLVEVVEASRAQAQQDHWRAEAARWKDQLNEALAHARAVEEENARLRADAIFAIRDIMDEGFDSERLRVPTSGLPPCLVGPRMKGDDDGLGS